MRSEVPPVGYDTVLEAWDMGLVQWLREFRELHERAKKSALAPEDLKNYHAGRDELARVLLSSQHVALEPGQRPRRELRTASALQADIECYDGTVRAITRQVSASGFSALLARPPHVDEEVKVLLRIPGGEPLRSSARVVGVKQQAGSAHVSFQLLGLEESEVERLELFVFDSVLTQLKG